MWLGANTFISTQLLFARASKVAAMHKAGFQFFCLRSVFVAEYLKSADGASPTEQKPDATTGAEQRQEYLAYLQELGL